MNKELTPFANKVCPKNCIANCKECELVEKKLKALELVKAALVPLVKFRKYEFTRKGKEHVWYGVQDSEGYGECDLTEEEYELLIEILEVPEQ